MLGRESGELKISVTGDAIHLGQLKPQHPLPSGALGNRRIAADAA